MCVRRYRKGGLFTSTCVVGFAFCGASGVLANLVRAELTYVITICGGVRVEETNNSGGQAVLVLDVSALGSRVLVGGPSDVPFVAQDNPEMVLVTRQANVVGAFRPHAQRQCLRKRFNPTRKVGCGADQRRHPPPSGTVSFLFVPGLEHQDNSIGPSFLLVNRANE
jgi:hypothetical protein